MIPSSPDDWMARLGAWIEPDRQVRQWCEANNGCQNVPCTCHARPECGQSLEPKRPRLQLVWSQP